MFISWYRFALIIPYYRFLRSIQRINLWKKVYCLTLICVVRDILFDTTVLLFLFLLIIFVVHAVLWILIWILIFNCFVIFILLYIIFCNILIHIIPNIVYINNFIVWRYFLIWELGSGTAIYMCMLTNN